MNLELIKLTASDSEINELLKMHNTPAIAKYVAISNNYFDYVTSTKGVVYYKIVVDGTLVGGIHLEFNDKFVSLCICIKEEYQQHGFAKAALQKLFLTLPKEVHTIEVSIDETNHKSQSLFTKLGFTKIAKDNELITYRMSIN